MKYTDVILFSPINKWVDKLQVNRNVISIHLLGPLDHMPSYC